MGSFYTNITLPGADDAAVFAWLDRAGRQAYVGVADGAVVVFDQAGEEQGGAHAVLAGELTAALGGRALAVMVHDSDVLFLNAFEAGNLVLEREVPEGYFDAVGEFDDEEEEEEDDEGAALGGDETSEPTPDAEILAALFGGDARRLAWILAADFVFAEERHAALVEALGLPVLPVGLGYRYIEMDHLPADAPALRRVLP